MCTGRAHAFRRDEDFVLMYVNRGTVKRVRTIVWPDSHRSYMHAKADASHRLGWRVCGHDIIHQWTGCCTHEPAKLDNSFSRMVKLDNSVYRDCAVEIKTAAAMFQSLVNAEGGSHQSEFRIPAPPYLCHHAPLRRYRCDGSASVCGLVGRLRVSRVHCLVSGVHCLVSVSQRLNGSVIAGA